MAPWGWTGLGGQILESLAGHAEELDFLSLAHGKHWRIYADIDFMI